MSQPRFQNSPQTHVIRGFGPVDAASPGAASPGPLGLALALLFALILVTAPAFAQVEETYSGAPDYLPLTPHVQLPNLGITHSGLDCSAWPVSAPAEGHVASIFGHRLLGSTPDFHRGLDLRCDVDGDICCQPGGTGPVTCGSAACSNPDDEVLAPVKALLGGTIVTAHTTATNSLVIKSDAPGITIGNTSCDELYIWYSHLKDDYAPEGPNDQPWEEGNGVQIGDHLGWQGKYGANTVHLHLSTRVCQNSRGDGGSGLDPEINPFQLVGTDNGVAPEILGWSSEIDGADIVVSVQIETDDPDFDQLEISVYDAFKDETHVRRLGYNSRYGIDIAGEDFDTLLLEPRDESELTHVHEPNPPSQTSGFTLEARFENLGLTFDYDSEIVVKVADVFGNTTVVHDLLFGDAQIGDFAWVDDDDDGLQSPGEPGLPGVEVELFKQGQGLMATTITDALGAYSFTGLPAGSYHLRFQPPGDYGATKQTPIFHNDTDSDIDTQTLETEILPLSNGQNLDSIDAGFTTHCFDVPLVSFNSQWSTSDTFTQDWQTENFDDSSWSTGQAPLGFKHDLVYTTVPNTGTTSYFRLKFHVDDVDFFNSFDLGLLRDDGAVVYLNGVEVMRSNMPAGPITHSTLASSHSDDLVETAIAASALKDNENVLAVEVHNRTTFDILFDLELSAKVCKPCVNEITLAASSGTVLDEGDPDDNLGSEPELEVDGGPDIRHALMAWDINNVPAFAEALAGEITVKITNSSDDGYQFFAVSRPWDESEATWNHAETGVIWGSPGASAGSDTGSDPVALAIPDVATGTDYVMPINADGLAVINGWVDGSLGNHGFLLRGDPASTNGADFDSDETSDAPELRLIYSTCH